MNFEKTTILTAVGAFGAALVGEWDGAIITLLLFMAADWLTGLTVAGVFKSSPKSETGRLESRVGLKGLCRKGAMLFIVIIAYDLTDCLIVKCYWRIPKTVYGCQDCIDSV